MTDLHGQELVDEWLKYNLFTVPHLFSIYLYSPPELPPLPTILHKDLKHTHTQKQTNTNAGLYKYMNTKLIFKYGKSGWLLQNS